MTGPYKVRETRQYTEVIYYNADGTEASRDTMLDDQSYDAEPPEPMTDEEIEDWL
ncbi:hypothetical protein KPL76_06310 [Subtercola sp. PAMC28395]|uniref:hypothetical protein n=1 Tax=Subtercola sp. PAMC28395 TaxID=2846775 RepID=UPI001C0D4F86|nr:hypothetical protein [Subtercola sp. PAMC28395]QWT24966.1 hypothetical protein KPL76_06310 [Subtercola sp. PAMC28395]